MLKCILLQKKLNFIEARAFVRKLGLKNTKDWEDYTKSESFPSFLRKSPSTYMYTGDWKGMPDWLGTSSQIFKSFKAARKYARSLNLKSSSEWNRFTKNPKFPKDIPRAPSHSYKDKGWINWSDWLGKN